MQSSRCFFGVCSFSLWCLSVEGVYYRCATQVAFVQPRLGAFFEGSQESLHCLVLKKRYIHRLDCSQRHWPLFNGRTYCLFFNSSLDDNISSYCCRSFTGFCDRIDGFYVDDTLTRGWSCIWEMRPLFDGRIQLVRPLVDILLRDFQLPFHTSHIWQVRRYTCFHISKLTDHYITQCRWQTE